MLEMVQLLAATNWTLLVFGVLIFDLPRYTFSLISLALLRLTGRPQHGRVVVGRSISVIVPTFNGGSGLAPTIASLYRQTVSDVLTPSCGARRSREDASPVDEMGSHTWSTI